MEGACGLCSKILSTPFTFACGHSFDKLCLIHANKENECPLCKFRGPAEMDTEITQAIQFHGSPSMKLLFDLGFSAKPIYEIYCIDVSSSMWYSDTFFGVGRLTLAT